MYKKTLKLYIATTLTITIFHISCNLIAMESLKCSLKESVSKLYHVPAIANKVFQEVKSEQLATIKSEDELADTGTITALVIRPKKDFRQTVSSIILTPEYIEGDKNKENETDKEFGAVTIMRADVSEALGGFHIPGDNIHVQGLHLGEKYLQPGDLLAIKTPQQELASILMQSFIPHYACWKLQARCGVNAFRFLHAEDPYETGFSKNGKIIHGLRDRLRGSRPIVLKSGKITVGDQISIIRNNEKNALLFKFSLTHAATLWLQNSSPLAEKLENEEAAKRKFRRNSLQKRIEIK
ncbi:MAG: hypothetical protein AMXMBFR12_09930 [Candidatus Babeliales bacterium]